MDSKFKQLETVLVVVVALVVAYFFRRSQWWLVAALMIGLPGLFSPLFRLVFHRVWMGLALMMGEVTGRVVLTVVYIFLLVPIAVIARRAGKVGLLRKPGGKSSFRVREHTYKSEDLLHPW